VVAIGGVTTVGENKLDTADSIIFMVYEYSNLRLMPGDEVMSDALKGGWIEAHKYLPALTPNP
jgi:hypothetical protein